MLQASDMNATVGDLQRNYLFKVLVPVIPSALKLAWADSEDVAKNMDVYVQKMPMPESANKAIGFLWAGEKVWFDGPNDAAMSVEVTFRCDRKYQAHRFFSEWKNLGGSDANQSAYPKAATIGQFTFLAVDVDKTTVLHAKDLLKAKVMKVGAQDFDKGGDAETTFTVTINFEKQADRYDNLGTV